MAERFSCAASSRSRGEPVFATASHVDRWLCLEQPGAWGADAVLESRLDTDVALALKARAREVGARLLLIRRYGRSEPGPRTVLVASSREPEPWLERFTVSDAAEVLDLDLSPLAGHASVGGERCAEPAFLVCTNGRHDACCAEYGRPVARTLSAALPSQTWECSHIGGDRFAGNLLCLPEGVYYGGLGPTDSARIATTHARGRVDLAHYRGRSSRSFVVQAAEHFARVRLDLLDLDALRPEEQRDVDEGVRLVRFSTGDGGDVIVTVGIAPDEREVRLTCQAARPERPPRYRLVELEATRT